MVTLDEVRHLTRHSSNWSLTDFDIILGTEEPSFKICSSKFFCRKIEMKGQVIYHFLAKNKLHVKLLCSSLGLFLWDVPHQYQCSEITWIMVDQMNRWILVQSGFIGSFDLPWSEWSQITDPDLDYPKGMHPLFACMYSVNHFLELTLAGLKQQDTQCS